MSRSPEGLRFLFANGRGSSGKDTQAEILVDKFPQATRISTGDIYRGAKTPDGPFGRFHQQIAPFIDIVDNGGYVSDEVMLPIVKQVIEEHIQEGKSMFIFTGFPRTIGQLEGVDNLLNQISQQYPVSATYLYFAVPDSLSRLRASSRVTKAIEQGTKVRDDDDPNIVENRLNTFKNKTLPMLKKLTIEKRLCIVKATKDIATVTDKLMLVLDLSPDSQ